MLTYLSLEVCDRADLLKDMVQVYRQLSQEDTQDTIRVTCVQPLVLCVRVIPPGVEWKRTESRKWEEIGRTNGKRTTARKRKERRKNGFSPFLGHFFLDFGQWAIFFFFSQCPPVFGFRSVFHSKAGVLTRSLWALVICDHLCDLRSLPIEASTCFLLSVKTDHTSVTPAKAAKGVQQKKSCKKVTNKKLQKRQKK